MGRQGWVWRDSIGKTITPQKRAGRYWCGLCRQYFTALTNTPLEGARVGLRKWLFAGYLLMTTRKGISSLQLSKELSVTQKKQRGICSTGYALLAVKQWKRNHWPAR